MKKPNDESELLPSGLPRATGDDLRRDRDARFKKETRLDLVEEIQRSAEPLLKQADGIEKTREYCCAGARALEDELEGYWPPDNAVGAGYCANLRLVRTRLRMAISKSKHKEIHSRVENLTPERAANKSVPFLAFLKSEVASFSQTVDAFPGIIEEMRGELRGYVEKKSRLPQNARYVGNEAQEGRPPVTYNSEITVIGNLKDHPKPSWE